MRPPGWSHKGEKHVDFKIHSLILSIFKPCFFPLRVLAEWVQTINGKFPYYFVLKLSSNSKRKLFDLSYLKNEVNTNCSGWGCLDRY